MSWTMVLVLSGGAYLFKAVGLLALGDREVPEPVLGFLGLLPPALLMALIVVQTLEGKDAALGVDARLAGLVVGGIAVWRKAPFLVVVASAAATTALIRALGS